MTLPNGWRVRKGFFGKLILQVRHCHLGDGFQEHCEWKDATIENIFDDEKIPHYVQSSRKWKGCSKCFGSGGKKNNPCQACNGSGKIYE